MRKAICNSIAAGIFIGIGGSVFLAIENKVVGAIFFTVALLCICQLDLLLYTGKIGFLAFDHGRTEICTTAVCLAGNCIGTDLAGTAIRYCRPQVIARAVTMMEDKLAVSFGRTFFTALFCGILMYAAVRIYRERQSLSGILFCSASRSSSSPALNTLSPICSTHGRLLSAADARCCFWQSWSSATRWADCSSRH